MAAIVPTRMIGVPPYSLIVSIDGTVIEVGPWARLTVDHNVHPCMRIINGVEQATDPDEMAAYIVPSTQDAVLNLINAGFQIKSAEAIDS
jgi:hypothetical protein